MTKDKTDINTLPIDEVSVQERSVTIRVLTVGTKQVTQALYKQLVDDSVLDNMGNIKGNIWGWVNFHSEYCGSSGSHLHTIWDDGGVLKRCCLYERYGPFSVHEKLSNQLNYAGLCYLYLAFNEGKLEIPEDDSISAGPIRKFAITIGRHHLNLTGQDSMIDLLRYHRNKCSYMIDVLQKKFNDDLSLYMGKSGISSTLFFSSSKLHEEMIRIEKELTEYEDTYARSYSEIKSSNQLFIAVSGVWK